MSVRLKRCVYALMVLSVALWAVLLAVSPAVAEAQGITRTKDAQQEGTERIGVSPGASLWSISEERLGPNATPQQIASEAERIYALNRNQIGADPNLIFLGQNSRTPISATAGKDEKAKASGPVAEPVSLPEVAAPAPRVPAVKALASKDAPRSPVESFARTVRSARSAAESTVVGAFPRDDHLGRKLLGLGIVLLTLIVCGLMVWKLPMRRNVEDYAAWNIPRGVAWNIPRGYPKDRAGPEALDRHADVSEEPSPPAYDSSPKPSLGGSEEEVSVAENDLSRLGIVGTVRGTRERIRRRQAPKRIGGRRAPRPRRRSPEESVTGACSPKIYRALRSRAELERRQHRPANGRAIGTRRDEGAANVRALLRKAQTVRNGHKPLEALVAGNEESRPEQRIHLLSARQREVLELVAEGLPNAQIARRLFITESTVKQHLYKAYKTLGVRNRREAAKSLESSNDRAGRQPMTEVEVRP